MNGSWIAIGSTTLSLEPAADGWKYSWGAFDRLFVFDFVDKNGNLFDNLLSFWAFD